jgi:hypothetical protein
VTGDEVKFFVNYKVLKRFFYSVPSIFKNLYCKSFKDIKFSSDQVTNLFLKLACTKARLKGKTNAVQTKPLVASVPIIQPKEVPETTAVRQTQKLNCWKIINSLWRV